METSQGVASPVEAVERVIAESKHGVRERPTRHKMSNGVCMGALSAAEELSKVGSKDKRARRWLAKLILYLREAVQEYQIEQNMILARWAARDEETGEIKTVADDKGNQRAQMKNEVEANLEAERLLHAPASVPEGDRPDAIDIDELEQAFVTTKGGTTSTAVQPELAARLGPFVKY